MRFLAYSPDQAYLLPPSVKDVLGEEHLCFFLHWVVERLDLSGFEQDYVEEGPPAYAPGLMVKVWLYPSADGLGVTSSRRAVLPWEFRKALSTARATGEGWSPAGASRRWQNSQAGGGRCDQHSVLLPLCARVTPAAERVGGRVVFEESQSRPPQFPTLRE